MRKVGMAVAIALVASLRAFGAGWSVGEGGEGDPPVRHWEAPPYWRQPSAEPGREALAGRAALAGGPTALPFIALPPCRVIDTRGNAPLTGGFLPPATVRSYTVTGVCGIPASAQALSLNAVVVHPTGPGFLTLYPQGGAFPPVSTLNFLGNDVIVNAAVVPISVSGGISMALGVSGGDVILDVNGYYAPTPTVTSLNTLNGDVTLAAGTNVTLTPSGNTLTIAAAGAQGPAGPTGPIGPPGPPGPDGWALTGNAATTPGTNFLGTTDNQALELKVNGERIARYEPLHATTAINVYGSNVIAGSPLNSVAAGVGAATIAGGGVLYTDLPGDAYGSNRVESHLGSIGGGAYNVAGSSLAGSSLTASATVAGGSGNKALGGASVIGGGASNTVLVAATCGSIAGGCNNLVAGQWSAVAGGTLNSVGDGSRPSPADWAFIGGGKGNWAAGAYAAVPGGYSNIAGGDYSFAAGRRAKTRRYTESGDANGDEGSFVWADSQDADFVSTGPNQFLVRASGGIGINKSNPAAGTLDVNGPVKAFAAGGGTAGTFDGSVSVGYNLGLPATAVGGTAGVVTFAASRFLHAYGGANTFLGGDSGNFTLDAGAATGNTGIGWKALASVTTGDANTGLGSRALTATTSGASNTGVGSGALSTNTTGINNTALGATALRSNLGGSGNVGVGVNALNDNVSGGSNVAVGTGALGQAIDASDNVAMGRGALFQVNASSGAGDGNVALGSVAGTTLVKGAYNILLGWGAGISLTSGNDEILIGADVAGSESGTIRVGTPGTHKNAYLAGVFGSTVAGGAAVYVDGAGKLGTITSSRRYKDDIQDMAGDSDVVMKLRPVSFLYRADLDETRTRQYGLIAEEVAQIAPDLVVWKDSQPETVRYHLVNAMLLNEVQKSRREIVDLNARLARLEAILVEVTRTPPSVTRNQRGLVTGPAPGGAPGR
ncbi:MAG: tail fiber domain-containing protein [Acidobacteria bacterium]|nr:tail fiber domain-containing protein [Acidobacteriota bacterium]